jgi:hypothetical protein
MNMNRGGATGTRRFLEVISTTGQEQAILMEMDVKMGK